MTRLAKLREFRADLASGRGRAWLAIARTRGRGFGREIDRACLHDLAYDPQCEGSRAEWLFELAGLAGRRDSVRRQLLRSLHRREPQPHSWTLLQRVELAARFAEHGDDEARDAVLEFFEKNAIEFRGHAEYAVLRAAGADGLAMALRLLADAPSERSRSDVLDLEMLLSVSVERLGLRTTNRVFDEIALERSGLCDLRARGRAELRTGRRPQSRWSNEEFEQILAGERHVAAFAIARWCRTAPRRVLDRLDRRIVTEDDERFLERLLAAFRERPLRHGLERALELAGGRNAALAIAALRSLVPTGDPRARELALRCIDRRSVRLASEAIGILAKHPRASDWLRIERRLRRVRGRDQVHAAAYALVDWIRAAPAVQASRALTWAWNHTPCSDCRESLLRSRPRTQWPRRITREALHDASSDVRKLARRVRLR